MDAGFDVQTSSQDVRIVVKSNTISHYLDFVKAYTHGAIDTAKTSTTMIFKILSGNTTWTTPNNK
jgi:hypothetical protein